MPKLVVLNQGHHATIQDLGRHHCAQFGLSPGGVSDLHAHCWGQKLLGNPSTNASVEILLGRIKLRAVGDIDAVLTGADCRAINAELYNPQQPQDSKLKVGNNVRFEAIDKREFISLGGKICPNW